MTKKKEPGKTRLEFASERLAQAKALHEHLLAQKRTKELAANRKLETRKKIILGSFLMSHMSKSAQNHDGVMGLVDKWLTRDNERVLFDLPPRAPVNDPSVDLNGEAANAALTEGNPAGS